MPKLEVKKRVVDPITGNTEMLKKVFYVDNKDPNNSIEYHKIADILEISRFERLDPHISEKLVTLYNWAAKFSKSNKIDKISQYIDNQKKVLGFPMLGAELVKNLYRKARFDLETVKDEERVDSWEKNRTSIDILETDHKKARDLRMQAGRQDRKYKKDLETIKQVAEELATERADQMPKNDMSVRVVRYKVEKEEL